jgi:hypothetical protein
MYQLSNNDIVEITVVLNNNNPIKSNIPGDHIKKYKKHNSSKATTGLEILMALGLRSEVNDLHIWTPSFSHSLDDN